MANYVTSTSVKAKLPTGYGGVLSDPTITQYILDASGEIDEKVGPRFTRQYEDNKQKFPEITDITNITPKIIEQCALWLTLSRCYEDLGEENRGDEGTNEPNKKYYRRIAMEELGKIESGETDVNVSITTRLWASEKYPDDESSFDRVFTNDEMDVYL